MQWYVNSRWEVVFSLKVDFFFFFLQRFACLKKKLYKTFISSSRKSLSSYSMCRIQSSECLKLLLWATHMNCMEKVC